MPKNLAVKPSFLVNCFVLNRCPGIQVEQFSFLFCFEETSNETKPHVEWKLQFVCFRARLKKGWVVWVPSYVFGEFYPPEMLFLPPFTFLKQRIPCVRAVSCFPVPTDALRE